MPAPSPPSVPGARTDSTAEKLQVISDLFGTRIAARVAPGATGAAAPQDRTRSPDDGRLEWQKNRLIEHLRRSGAMTGAAPQDQTGNRTKQQARSTAVTAAGSMTSQPTARDPGEPARGAIAPGPESAGFPAPLARVLSRAGTPGILAHEHPAILARLLTGADQPTRVTVLRQLPGWLARDVMQRLRAPR